MPKTAKPRTARPNGPEPGAATPDTGLAPLTEADIRAWADPGSYQRGVRYHRDGRIFDPVCRGATLRARCRGSSGGPYDVTATLAPAAPGTSDPIAASACACPLGGYCKHAVALLLTWLRTPEAFAVRPGIREQLAARSRDELVALVELLLRRRPELEDLLDLPLPVPATAAGGDGAGATNATGAVDAEVVRRQVRAAYRRARAGGDWDVWDAAPGVAGELDGLLALGEGYLDAGRWADAQGLFAALFEEIGREEDILNGDEEGILYEIAAACVEGLIAVLNAQAGLAPSRRLDADARSRPLRALYDAWLCDVDLGDQDIAGGAPKAIAEAADDAERSSVIGWLRQELRSKGDRGDAGEPAGAGARTPTGVHSRGFAGEPGVISIVDWDIHWDGGDAWHDRALVDCLVLLLEREPGGVDPEAILAAYRDAQLWDEVAARLVELGRTGEAVTLAARQLTRPVPFLAFADLLVARGGAEAGRALALVEDRLWETEGKDAHADAAYQAWLGHRYAALDRPDAALAMARRRFVSRPARDTFDAVATAARLPGQPPGTWEKVRPELIATLREKAHPSILIDIHLDAGDVRAALDALAEMESAARKPSKRKRDAPDGWFALGWIGVASGDQRQRLAAAAEADYPDEAIALYRGLAERAIEQRARPAYQRAAGYLDRVRALREAKGEGEGWREEIAALRAKHKTLRALREELDARSLT
jgi:hypothetical protein